ncbi:MAG: MCE family protein [Bacteroidales bacterium]|nr:MCE family protein [Bacteroidales bacterium]
MGFLSDNKKRIFFIAIISVIFVIILLLTTKIFFTSKSYYAVFDNIQGLEINDHVIIENVKVGKVNDIRFYKTDSGRLIVKLHINSEVNIPDKSIAEIITYDTTGSCKAVAVKLFTSGGYLKNGDIILTQQFPVSVDSIINLSTRVDQLQKDSSNLNNIDSESPDKQTTGKIAFKVQILTSNVKLKLNSPKFKGINGVEMYFENGMYKYTAGKQFSIETANLLCESVKNIGFPDAFVVAFNNGKRISIKEAVRILKN